MQKQVTANVPAPDKICSEGNLPQNWKRFKRQFENYSIAREEDESYQVAVFLAVLGPDACEIYDNLKFEAPDDKNDLKKVMKKLSYTVVLRCSRRFHLKELSE